MKKACFVSTNGPQAIDQAYSQSAQTKLQETLDFLPALYTHEPPDERYQECHYIFSTWGCPAYDKAFLEQYFPQLEAVFYAAGSVKAFAEGYLNAGVKLYAAASVNAIPVADFCLGQIILASKGYFHLAREMSYENHQTLRKLSENYPSSYGLTIGLIGFGQIARLLTEKIQAILDESKILVYDPFISSQEIASYGAQKIDKLPDLFKVSEIVSNHLPNLPETVGNLNYELFAAMPRYATFINTGRGAQVVEEDLAKALRERPDLTALLDVTWPEPPQAGHPFYELKNVFYSPHIAGSKGREIQRMGDAMYDAYKSHEKGENSHYEIKAAALAHMA